MFSGKNMSEIYEWWEYSITLGVNLSIRTPINYQLMHKGKLMIMKLANGNKFLDH